MCDPCHLNDQAQQQTYRAGHRAGRLWAATTATAADLDALETERHWSWTRLPPFVQGFADGALTALPLPVADETTLPQVILRLRREGSPVDPF